MSVLGKIVTALKGGINEAGDAFADSQALRMLDQEVRQADEDLKQSRNSLAAMMARQRLSEKKLEELKTAIDEHEGYTLKALEQEDEGLARDVAVRIASLESDVEAESAVFSRYTDDVADLRSMIKLAERDITHLKHQVDMVRATDTVQRAQATVSQRHGGSSTSLQTAMDSLARIRDRQALQSAERMAAQELDRERNDASLEERLVAAGIKPASSSADAVLDRLKARETNRR